jgi:hypothetical protein
MTELLTSEERGTRIREIWPTVARMPPIANLGKFLNNTIILAPLGWLLMSAVYFGKLLPFVATRYTVTNRRLMIRKGITGKPGQEIPLGEIDDVRIVTDANSDFFRAATLEILSKGQVRMKLAGVPEADSFRLAILNARNAWVPEKSKTMPFIPASAAK